MKKKAELIDMHLGQTMGKTDRPRLFTGSLLLPACEGGCGERCLWRETQLATRLALRAGSPVLLRLLDTQMLL